MPIRGLSRHGSRSRRPQFSQSAAARRWGDCLDNRSCQNEGHLGYDVQPSFGTRTASASRSGGPAVEPPGTINAQGGVPIKVGEATIGAVGVSGAPGGDKDAACANAALAKVADKLH